MFTINSNVQLLSDTAIISSQKWFRDKLIVVGLNSFQPDIITRLKNHPKQLKFATDMFSEIGLGLNGIEVRTENFDKWLAANPQESNIQSKTEKMPDDMVLSKIVNNRNVSAITLEKGIRKVSELVFKQAGVEGYSRDMDIQSQSDGTVRLLILAPYLYSAVYEGATIVVDELDSSIHFKLTRSIVSIFNNELNDKAQLIFTAHDVSLMDCKKLFRKEQIWFVHKDDDGVYLYSLASFTAEEGVRETTDIIEKYKRGVLGAIPEPDMLKTLLQVKNGK